MVGFLRTSPVVIACSFLGLVSFRLVSGFIRKKSEQRSIRSLIPISPKQLFDLIWLSLFVTVWFFVIWLGDMMNGPAVSYSAMLTLLGFPVLRVILVYVMARMQVTRSKNPRGG